MRKIAAMGCIVLALCFLVAGATFHILSVSREDHHRYTEEGGEEIEGSKAVGHSEWQTEAVEADAGRDRCVKILWKVCYGAAAVSLLVGAVCAVQAKYADPPEGA